MNWFGTRDIKVHLGNTLNDLKGKISGQRALDFPCGNGETLKLLDGLGATAIGGDLFPELEKYGHEVSQADLAGEFPFQDQEFDLAICQEGIEHVGAQNLTFNEFSRILKNGGTFVLTTPNYSKIKSRLSYLFTESEAYGRIMPPNEGDSIWLSEGAGDRIYFGHVFLTGILRLRLFAVLSGFQLKKIHSSKVNYTSLLWFPLVYPLIYFYSLRTYRRFVRKGGSKELGREVFHLMVSPKILLENHLILEFEKVEEVGQAIERVKSKGSFSMTT
ncbi:MAG: class I SAM-dependent methyltransferase [Pseudomonadota bacterium]